VLDKRQLHLHERGNPSLIVLADPAGLVVGYSQPLQQAAASATVHFGGVGKDESVAA
jgi:hypothetical protein